MIIFLFILLIIISNGASFSYEDSFNESYISKNTTTAINGVFVILVLFSHYAQYANFASIYDEPYSILRGYLSQMVVVTFLFYSGYGMMESIRRKGDQYIKNIISKAFLLLIRFDIAVLLYLILQTAFGKSFPIEKVAMSFLMWDSLGNSNWYIFDIIVMYLLMFAAFMPRVILKNKRSWNAKKGTTDHFVFEILLFFFLTLMFIYILKVAGKETRWYNTLILFPVGILYSEMKRPIERAVMRSDITYFITCMVVGGIYSLSFLHRDDSLIMYDVWAVAFMFSIVLFTMKVKIGNGIINWFGGHVFSVYILQRIPMIVMHKMGFIDSHKYMSLIIVILSTITIAAVFDKLTAAAERLLIRKSFTENPS